MLSYHDFFQFRKKQKSLVARTTHLITGQLKHWLQSKIPALNYSVTHRIRHSCSYCTEKKRAQKKGGKVEKEKKRKKGKKNKAFAVTTERLRVSQRGRNESQITLNVNAAKTLNIFITCNFQA